MITTFEFQRFVWKLNWKVNLYGNMCARLMYESLVLVILKIYSMGQVWNVNCAFRDVSATIIIIPIFCCPNLTSLNTVGRSKSY